MKVDVIHDYDEMPEEEISNSKEVLERAENFRLIDVVRKPDHNIGLEERVNLAVILYEDVE